MNEYHKIPTVWTRDPETKFRTLINGEWATQELAALHGLNWEWTEKVDGTNIRVHWDGESVEFRGRTDKAQIPPRLLDALRILFTPEDFQNADLSKMTLYGEGYGAGIQKCGSLYLPKPSFILFDVFCGGLWLERQNVVGIAAGLGVKTAPILGYGPLLEAIDVARSKPTSIAAEAGRMDAEGLVMRPPCGLLDRQGGRIICKVKARDFR